VQGSSTTDARKRLSDPPFVFSSESLEIKKMRRGWIIRTRRKKTGRSQSRVDVRGRNCRRNPVANYS
jgi:hypothetical protein